MNTEFRSMDLHQLCYDKLTNLFSILQNVAMSLYDCTIDIRVHVRDWKRPNARDRVAY